MGGDDETVAVTFDPRGVRPSSLVFWKALLMHMDANYCDFERASVFIDFWRDEHSAKILRRNCGIYQQYLVTFDPRGVRPKVNQFLVTKFSVKTKPH